MRLLPDRSADFEDAGVRVMAISRDSPYTHVAWMQALDLDFPLLSDWNGDATRAYGVAQRYRGLGDVPTRSAFLVDGDRVVRFAKAYETDELPDLDEIVGVARELA